jgi:hypothetical protein
LNWQFSPEENSMVSLSEPERAWFLRAVRDGNTDALDNVAPFLSRTLVFRLVMQVYNTDEALFPPKVFEWFFERFGLLPEEEEELAERAPTQNLALLALFIRRLGLSEKARRDLLVALVFSDEPGDAVSAAVLGVNGPTDKQRYPFLTAYREHADPGLVSLFGAEQTTMSLEALDACETSLSSAARLLDEFAAAGRWEILEEDFDIYHHDNQIPANKLDYRRYSVFNSLARAHRAAPWT